MSLEFPRITKFAAVSLIALLTGCGQSGPSKPEAEKALDDLVAQFGGARAPHIKLTDLKCSKTGDETYNCQVLASLNGTDVQDVYTFTKLGGSWRASH